MFAQSRAQAVFACRPLWTLIPNGPLPKYLRPSPTTDTALLHDKICSFSSLNYIFQQDCVDNWLVDVSSTGFFAIPMLDTMLRANRIRSFVYEPVTASPISEYSAFFQQ